MPNTIIMRNNKIYFFKLKILLFNYILKYKIAESDEHLMSFCCNLTIEYT